MSLKDVAEQHELEYDHATPDLKLRYQKIQFVPAGTHTPVGPRDDDKRATTANSRQGNQEETPIDKFASMRLGSEVTENASRPKFREGGLESAEKPQTILANPAPRSLSPTPSNSSEEVVVFKGRNPTASVSSTKRPDTSAVSLKLPTPAWNDTGKDWAHREDKTARKEKKKTQDVDVARELAISQSRGPKKARKLQNRQLRDLDDEAFQDYLMNLIENDEHDAFDDVLSNTVETGGDLSDNDGDDDDVSEFDDDDDDGSDDDDDGSNLESEHDEDDLIERRKAAMTDEHIARILSKQEELGIGSAEIVLFDGVDVGEDDGRDFFVRNRGSNSGAAQSLKVRRRERGRKKTAMEDYPYGDFDVMDFDRPSLQLRSKASVPLMAEDISDEDLRSTIQESWEADRRKKRLKKAERQELRAQGLLGKKKKRGVANSIEQNIPGMGKDEILDTIRDFLRSSSPRYYAYIHSEGLANYLLANPFLHFRTPNGGYYISLRLSSAFAPSPLARANLVVPLYSNKQRRLLSTTRRPLPTRTRS